MRVSYAILRPFEGQLIDLASSSIGSCGAKRPDIDQHQCKRHYPLWVGA